MNHQALIAKKTNELAAALGIADQVAGLSTKQQLANIAIRFTRIGKTAAAAKCLAMADLA